MTTYLNTIIFQDGTKHTSDYLITNSDIAHCEFDSFCYNYRQEKVESITMTRTSPTGTTCICVETY